MNSSAHKPDGETVLLSEEVRPRATPLYTCLLFFIALAVFSCFLMAPVPRVLYRIILVLIGACFLIGMTFCAIRRTAVSFIYELTGDSLYITRVLWRHRTPCAMLKLCDIEKMDRLSAGLPRGKRVNACVTRLAACEKGVYLLTASALILIEPSESFARTLSHAAAVKNKRVDPPSA